MKKLALLFIGFAFIACEKDDENGDPGNTTPVDPGVVMDEFSVDFENQNEPLASLFSSHTCGICGQSGHPSFDTYLGQNPDVNGVSFNHRSSDPLHHPDAFTFAGLIRIAGQPSFISQLTDFRSSSSSWGNAIGQEKGENVSAQIAMSGLRLDEDRFEIQSQILPMTAGNYDDVTYTVFLVENNVVSPQQDYGASPSLVQDYIHNHVYRGSTDGVFGSSIKANYSQKDTLSLSGTITVPAEVNQDNIYFVGVLWETDSSGNPTNVIQSQKLLR